MSGGEGRYGSDLMVDLLLENGIEHVALNPGATSTKVALLDDDEAVRTEVRHADADLARFAERHGVPVVIDGKGPAADFIPALKARLGDSLHVAVMSDVLDRELLWLAAVAVPHLLSGDMSTQMSSVLSSVSVVVVILAVTPWDYVWSRYVRASGDPWR